MIQLMASYPLYSNRLHPYQDGKTMVAISFQFGDDLTGQLNVAVDEDISDLSNNEKVSKAKEKLIEKLTSEQEG